ncbi:MULTISPECIES: metallophosphoesterase family protein [Rhodomicrobium]|uniref:metallophosphoesterase family protein n=1 Tax=Rhodomicrobium TaxID=1068 RepID=UPI000B4BE980|nr:MULTISPECIES: metallophosphoesterase family protein [Rhodomicrobium]
MTELDAHAVIGVISDTHGQMRPSALAALRGSDFIIHAGDVGQLDVLDSLRSIAPVLAVRGNVDPNGADALPMSAIVSLGGHRIYVLHILADLALDPAAAGFAAVIYGHSHKPGIAEKNGVAYFNPGAAGPRRFSLPVTVGRLRLAGSLLKPEIIPIEG